MSDRLDTSWFRAPISISCSGENWMAVEVIWCMHPMTGDSNVILISHDGGLSWSTIATRLPQWKYIPDSHTVEGYRKQGLFYNLAQQIDSLNAVVADQNAGMLLITHDGWRTFRADSTDNNIRGISFASAAEGLLEEEQFGMLGPFRSTVDSGKHWKVLQFDHSVILPYGYHSYGDSMFRIFQFPMIFTTHNNWTSWDTSYVTSDGPLADTSFHAFGPIFGPGTQLAIQGWRWYANSRAVGLRGSLALALSSDLGKHWAEAPVPQSNGIWYHAAPDQLSMDWTHMVMAGSDSNGRIVQSFDAGGHWECDSVLLNTGIPYLMVYPFTVTRSGRVLAGIVANDNVAGSSSLAYLEQVKASVSMPSRTTDFVLFPNPATTTLTISDQIRPTITDALGRIYECAWDGSSLDVSHLPPGVYFVSDGHSCAKFLKE